MHVLLQLSYQMTARSDGFRPPRIRKPAPYRDRISRASAPDDAMLGLVPPDRHPPLDYLDFVLLKLNNIGANRRVPINFLAYIYLLYTCSVCMLLQQTVCGQTHTVGSAAPLIPSTLSHRDRGPLVVIFDNPRRARFCPAHREWSPPTAWTRSDVTMTTSVLRDIPLADAPHDMTLGLLRLEQPEGQLCMDCEDPVHPKPNDVDINCTAYTNLCAYISIFYLCSVNVPFRLNVRGQTHTDESAYSSIPYTPLHRDGGPLADATDTVWTARPRAIQPKWYSTPVRSRPVATMTVCVARACGARICSTITIFYAYMNVYYALLVELTSQLLLYEYDDSCTTIKISNILIFLSSDITLCVVFLWLNMVIRMRTHHITPTTTSVIYRINDNIEHITNMAVSSSFSSQMCQAKESTDQWELVTTMSDLAQIYVYNMTILLNRLCPSDECDRALSTSIYAGILCCFIFDILQCAKPVSQPDERIYEGERTRTMDRSSVMSRKGPETTRHTVCYKVQFGPLLSNNLSYCFYVIKCLAGCVTMLILGEARNTVNYFNLMTSEPVWRNEFTDSVLNYEELLECSVKVECGGKLIQHNNLENMLIYDYITKIIHPIVIAHYSTMRGMSIFLNACHHVPDEICGVLYKMHNGIFRYNNLSTLAFLYFFIYDVAMSQPRCDKKISYGRHTTLPTNSPLRTATQELQYHLKDTVSARHSTRHHLSRLISTIWVKRRFSSCLYVRGRILDAYCSIFIVFFELLIIIVASRATQKFCLYSSKVTYTGCTLGYGRRRDIKICLRVCRPLDRFLSILILPLGGTIIYDIVYTPQTLLGNGYFKYNQICKVS